MEVLNNEEMIKYSGGVKITAGVVVLIAAISTFIFGIFDGYSNPKACNR